MKKVLISFVMLLSCIVASATSYTATSVSCSVKNAPWSDWASMNCQVVINTNPEQLIIFSDVDYSTTLNTYQVVYTRYQILNITASADISGVNPEGISYKGCSIIGYDANGTKCKAAIFSYSDGDLMLLIYYGDIKYKYMLK